MKTEILKKRCAFLLAILLIASLLVLPAFAETEATGTENEVQEPAEQYVIIPAETMEGRLNPNAVSAAEIVEEGGLKLLRLSVTKVTNDPYVSFDPEEDYSADVYKYAMLLVRSSVVSKDVSFELFYDTDGNGNTFKGGSSKVAKYSNLSTWQFLTFDYSQKADWTGNLDKLRYDFLSGGDWPEGVFCDIAGLVLSKDVEGLYDAAHEMMIKVCPPKQVISDFTEADVGSLSGGSKSTGVSLKDGNLIYLAMPNYDDPQAYFRYDLFAEGRGIDKLTTDDFQYTVIRYRTSMTIPKPNLELFVLTGDATNTVHTIRTAGTYTCHSGAADYQNTRTWRGVMVNMAEDDGLEENTAMKYGWQGRGAFNGFRFDWCGGGDAGAYMEVSSFLFFADKISASVYMNAINTLTIPLPLDSNIEEETYETVDVVMPWETETEAPSETETLPVYSEETLPEYTEDTNEETVEETVEDSTEASEVETETDEDSENETTPSGGGDNFGGIDIGGDEEQPQEKGSEMPFLIACISLAGLSVASIATVVVIRIREKM